MLASCVSFGKGLHGGGGRNRALGAGRRAVLSRMECAPARRKEEPGPRAHVRRRARARLGRPPGDPDRRREQGKRNGCGPCDGGSPRSRAARGDDRQPGVPREQRTNSRRRPRPPARRILGGLEARAGRARAATRSGRRLPLADGCLHNRRNLLAGAVRRRLARRRGRPRRRERRGLAPVAGRGRSHPHLRRTRRCSR